jgi:colicin import membrane protein
MFIFSFVLHAAVFLLIFKAQHLPAPPPEEPVTYVDMVALPVASPQSGTPAPGGASAAEPAAAPAEQMVAPPPPRPAQHEAMTVPTPKAKPAKTKPAPTKTAKTAKPAPEQSAGDAKAFNERMAKLEEEADEVRQARVLAGIKGKVGKGGRVGMPGGKGTQAGSDYTSYVLSRLKDAFAKEMMKQTASPLVVGTITVGADGDVSDFSIDRYSGDKLFDDSVRRAVKRATPFPPPPAGQFKRKVQFRPQGIAVR